MRVVSLVPSHTEVLFALGLAEQIVGVTAHCDYPPQVKQKERVGNFAEPRLERIISMKPDLVVAGGKIHLGIVEELRRMGITVYAFEARSVEELLDHMCELSRITGSAGGQSLIDELKRRLDVIRQKRTGCYSPRTIFIMGSDVIVVPGPGVCQYDALQIAGAEQMPIGKDVSYAFVSWADIVKFDPEIILACGRPESGPPKRRCPGCTSRNRPCARSVESIKNRPELAVVSAVKSDRVSSVPCHFFCRIGPRLWEGMEWFLKTYILSDKK